MKRNGTVTKFDNTIKQRQPSLKSWQTYKLQNKLSIYNYFNINVTTLLCSISLNGKCAKASHCGIRKQ